MTNDVITSNDRYEAATFLTQRLREELGSLWARDLACARPERRTGLAAQVAVLDDLLGVLDRGRLPERRDLRILLLGYGQHTDYDPRWTELLAC